MITCEDIALDKQVKSHRSYTLNQILKKRKEKNKQKQTELDELLLDNWFWIAKYYKILLKWRKKSNKPRNSLNS